MSALRFFWSSRALGVFSAVLTVSLLAPSGASAQDAEATDGRWLPWYGCWQPTGASDDSTRLCLLPVEGDRGVEMLTRANEETLSREIVLADGMDRAVSREGCEGRERVQFSSDAARVYFRSDLLCEGGVRRVSEGMMSMLSPFEWMDVQTVDVDGERVPWTVRYQLVTTEAEGFEDPTAGRAMAVGAARAAASRPPSLDDVIEASSHLGPQTVQAWVIEQGEPFDLDARGLARLADAGVPELVIDGVVAVSFPDRFAVGHEEAYVDDGYDRVRYRSRYPYGRYYSPYYLDPFYSSYYGVGYYSPFNAGFGRGFGGGFFGRSTVVFVDRSGSGRVRDNGGRVVRGRGFTSGRRNGSGSDSARRRSGSASSRSVARSGSSRSSSGRASASRGSSRSSGKSSRSRTAKKRGG